MRTTKKALTLSILSVLLCVAMLVGTTFAWFSDSVTSGANKIVAGNLDIDVEYSKDGSTWTAVEGDSGLFADVSLWEPGAFSVVYLRVSNKGTLALKYRLAVTTEGGDFTNQAGEAKNLKDALKFAQIASSALVRYETREDAAAATAENAVGMNDFTQVGTMAVGDVSYITLVVAMPSDIGNEFNYKTGTPAPVISLSLTVNAVQLSSESDSFDNTYDLASPWVGGIAEVPAEEDGVITIMSAEQLAGFAKAVNEGNDFAGKTVVLGKDLDLNNVLWTPIGNVSSYPSDSFAGVFDGQNYTISNLTCTDTTENYACAGLFGSLMGTVKNVNLTNVSIKSTHYAGAIVGYSSSSESKVENCTVDGGTIVSVPEWLGTEYDNGDKVGGIFGYNGEGGPITSCAVKNLTITGYRDIGGIVGATAGNISNNTVENVVLVQDNTNGYKATMPDTVGEILGRDLGATPAGNTVTNVTVKHTVAVTPDTVNSVMSGIVNNTVVTFGEGSYEIIRLDKNDASLSAEARQLSGMTFKAAEGATVTVKGFELSGLQNSTVEGFIFLAEEASRATKLYTGETPSYDEAYTASIMTGALTNSIGANDVTIKNCVFQSNETLTDDQISNYVAIDLFRPDVHTSAHGRAEYGNITVEGCQFLTYAFNYIRFDYNGRDGESVLTLKNNIFGDAADNKSTKHSIVNATGSDTDIDFVGNTCYNWGRYIIGCSLNPDEGQNQKCSVTVTGNTFTNCNGVGATGAFGNKVGLIDMKQKNDHKDVGLFATASGNTYAGALAGTTDASAIEWE